MNKWTVPEGGRIESPHYYYSAGHSYVEPATTAVIHITNSPRLLPG